MYWGVRLAAMALSIGIISKRGQVSTFNKNGFFASFRNGLSGLLLNLETWPLPPQGLAPGGALPPKYCGIGCLFFFASKAVLEYNFVSWEAFFSMREKRLQFVRYQ
jgi:hypothetical protein